MLYLKNMLYVYMSMDPSTTLSVHVEKLDETKNSTFKTNKQKA